MSRRTNLSGILADDNLGTEATDFLESLKTHDYHLLDPTYNERIRYVNASKDMGELIANHTFELGDMPRIPLAPLNLADPALCRFVEAGLHRSSQRRYAPEGLSLHTLSQLLQAAYFNKNNVSVREGVISAGDQAALKWKNIASGGGLYTVEVYYVNFRTDGLEPGTYHYNVDQKSLDQIRPIDSPEQVAELNRAFFADNQSVIDFDTASGVIVLAGIINRASFKYGNRAIAFAYIDAGAIINNLYSVSGMLNVGCCGNGGYLDDTLKTYLDLRTKNQVILSTVVIGSR